MGNSILLIPLFISLAHTLQQSSNHTTQLTQQQEEWNTVFYECKAIGQALAGLSGLSQQEFVEALIYSGDVLGMTYRVSSEDSRKHFILIQDNKLNWYQAYADCRRRGLRLATIENKDEQSRLTKLIKTTISGLKDKKEHNFWVAGSEVGELGEWVWVSSGRAVGSQGWTQDIHSPIGQTQGQSKTCMIVSYNTSSQVAHWVRTSCDTNYFFICENMW